MEPLSLVAGVVWAVGLAHDHRPRQGHGRSQSAGQAAPAGLDPVAPRAPGLSQPVSLGTAAIACMGPAADHGYSARVGGCALAGSQPAVLPAPRGAGGPGELSLPGLSRPGGREPAI